MSNLVQAARTFHFVPGTRPERFAKALATAVDPAQVEPSHHALRPAARAIDLARRVLAADAERPGAARLDGQVIDRSVVLQAQRTLSLARE